MTPTRAKTTPLEADEYEDDADEGEDEPPRPPRPTRPSPRPRDAAAGGAPGGGNRSARAGEPGECHVLCTTIVIDHRRTGDVCP